MREVGSQPLNSETSSKHRRYDEAFKRSAVEHWMVQRQGRNIHCPRTGNQHAEPAQVETKIQSAARWPGGAHAGRELVHRGRFATQQEARAAIFEWIEIFYNRAWFHSALGYKSPVDFENQLN